MKWKGDKFRGQLAEAQVSQSGLARELGVSRQAVVSWTKGQVPRGLHLLAICRLLGVDPGVFFEEGPSPVQVAPLHRRRRNAKETPEMRQSAVEMAKEYACLLEAGSMPALEMVARAAGDVPASRLAQQMRDVAGLTGGHEPPDYQHVFRMMSGLGICVIFRAFPEELKGYAFYTVVNGQRAVFVNSTTNLLDLNFPVLHEAVHAVRSRTPKGEYGKAEEALCDQVAGLVQFPDAYVDDAYDAIKDRVAGAQINTLKSLARRHHHAIFGLVRRIEERHPDFDLDGRSVHGADANLRKEQTSIYEVFVSHGAARFVDLLRELTPIWYSIVADNVDTMTTSKLAEALGLESVLDAMAAREEILARREGVVCGCRV